MDKPKQPLEFGADPKYYVLKKIFIKYPYFQNNVQSNAFTLSKLSCHKTVVTNYGFTF